MWLIALLVFALSAGQDAPSTDAHLEECIRARLEQSNIDAEALDVRVSRGVATLHGYARTTQSKAAATRIARKAGARQVVNRIQVSEAAKSRSGQRMGRGRHTGRP